ncbi:hypothetical protein HAX54_026801, partial [Datura stramonium]|nr:hypothetical protein [Datura stramonium]
LDAFCAWVVTLFNSSRVDFIVKDRDTPCNPTQLSQVASTVMSCFSCNHRDIVVRVHEIVFGYSGE